MDEQPRILVTGAAGYVGSLLMERLTEQFSDVRGIDIRTDSSQGRTTQMDIRDPALSDLMQKQRTTHVVHLACIVEPGKDPDREYDIDVNGTRNVLRACTESGVRHLTVTSSGAAYGYHPDNPEWITESDPLRGNDSFSYSRHKRLVEEMLQEHRRTHPQLSQLILRPGTVLGDTPPNMITRLLTGRRILALKGCPSPFVFIWDQDLVRIIAHGVEHSITGQFNVAGEGCLSVQEIAEIMQRPLLTVPVWLLRGILSVARPLKLVPWGPEQIRFMQYRPVLSARRLRTEFGIVPEKSSREVLEYFAQRHSEQHT